MKKQPHQTGRGPYKSPPEIRLKKTIRFSANEWEQVRASADRLHTKPAAYVRKAALRPLTAPRIKTPHAAEIRLELQRIGNNLNQLARIAHLRDVDPQALNDALRDLKQAVQNLKDDP